MNKAKQVRVEFERVANEYLRLFCKKHSYDYESIRSWVGGDVGGIAEVGDYYVDIVTIRTDIDRDAPEEEFVKWYDYCLRLGMLSSETETNPHPISVVG